MFIWYSNSMSINKYVDKKTKNLMIRIALCCISPVGVYSEVNCIQLTVLPAHWWDKYAHNGWMLPLAVV